MSAAKLHWLLSDRVPRSATLSTAALLQVRSFAPAARASRVGVFRRAVTGVHTTTPSRQFHADSQDNLEWTLRRSLSRNSRSGSRGSVTAEETAASPGGFLTRTATTAEVVVSKIVRHHPKKCTILADQR